MYKIVYILCPLSCVLLYVQLPVSCKENSVSLYAVTSGQWHGGLLFTVHSVQLLVFCKENSVS